MLLLSLLRWRGWLRPNSEIFQHAIESVISRGCYHGSHSWADLLLLLLLCLGKEGHERICPLLRLGLLS